MSNTRATPHGILSSKRPSRSGIVGAQARHDRQDTHLGKGLAVVIQDARTHQAGIVGVRRGGGDHAPDRAPMRRLSCAPSSRRLGPRAGCARPEGPSTGRITRPFRSRTTALSAVGWGPWNTARTPGRPTPAVMWAAFLARDRRWDGHFVTAVRTTGIFCRPSCTCRKAAAEERALLPLRRCARARAGFRPCKRSPAGVGGRDERGRPAAGRAGARPDAEGTRRGMVGGTAGAGAGDERVELRAALPRRRAHHAVACPGRDAHAARSGDAEARRPGAGTWRSRWASGSGSAFARAWRRYRGTAPRRAARTAERRRSA